MSEAQTPSIAAEHAAGDHVLVDMKLQLLFQTGSHFRFFSKKVF